MNLYDVGHWKLLHSRLLDLLASAACFGGMLQICLYEAQISDLKGNTDFTLHTNFSRAIQ